jgi:molybdopterin converting factor subunit 1
MPILRTVTLADELSMITVHYFAGLRELACTAVSTHAWQLGMTIAEVRKLVSEQYPKVTALLARSRIAINDTLADDTTLVPENAEIALLPPVSGG